jgi:hypothetical protein
MTQLQVDAGLNMEVLLDVFSSRQIEEFWNKWVPPSMSGKRLVEHGVDRSVLCSERGAKVLRRVDGPLIPLT